MQSLNEHVKILFLLIILRKIEVSNFFLLHFSEKAYQCIKSQTLFVVSEYPQDVHGDASKLIDFKVTSIVINYFHAWYFYII